MVASGSESLHVLVNLAPCWVCKTPSIATGMEAPLTWPPFFTGTRRPLWSYSYTGFSGPREKKKLLESNWEHLHLMATDFSSSLSYLGLVWSPARCWWIHFSHAILARRRRILACRSLPQTWACWLQKESDKVSRSGSVTSLSTWLCSPDVCFTSREGFFDFVGEGLEHLVVPARFSGQQRGLLALLAQGGLDHRHLRLRLGVWWVWLGCGLHGRWRSCTGDRGSLHGRAEGGAWLGMQAIRLCNPKCN